MSIVMNNNNNNIKSNKKFKNNNTICFTLNQKNSVSILFNFLLLCQLELGFHMVPSQTRFCCALLLALARVIFAPRLSAPIFACLPTRLYLQLAHICKFASSLYLHAAAMYCPSQCLLNCFLPASFLNLTQAVQEFTYPCLPYPPPS